MSPDLVRTANLGGFTEGFYALIADGKRTEQEDEKLTVMRRAFGVAASDMAPMLAKTDQVRRARQIEESHLQAIEAGISLKKGEACYD